MKIGISIVEMNSEFNGHKQKVQMVKVRDMAKPSQFGLAPLAPEGASSMSEQEQFDTAVARALEELKKKKGL